MPERVERRIKTGALGFFVAPTFCKKGIQLDPKGIGAEGVRAALIIESIEHQLHGVVTRYVLAPDHPGADVVWFIIEADEDAAHKYLAEEKPAGEAESSLRKDGSAS